MKQEIYAAAFGSHLFYDIFSQGWGEAIALLPPPYDPLLELHAYTTEENVHCSFMKIRLCEKHYPWLFTPSDSGNKCEKDLAK